MSFKSNLKKELQKFPKMWKLYTSIKAEFLRVYNLRFFFYDMRRVYTSMNWSIKKEAESRLSSELLFQYHKLEKGLVMPGPKRLFGLAPAEATMSLIERWNSGDIKKDNEPIYLGAIGTLQSYRNRIEQFELDPSNLILSKLNSFLDKYDCQQAEFSTPCSLSEQFDSAGTPSENFRELMEARRSVRDYVAKPVPYSVIEDSIRVAQLSPSACNRQPCQVSIYSNQEMKEELLSHQNGNAGFGHLAPHIAVLTADESCFFGATERHEPFVDGGLFAMSFILALKSQGVSSCCLNWCVKPNTDKAVHKLLGIAQSRRIIMLIAIGYAPEGNMVPRSPRRDLAKVLQCDEETK